MVELVEVLQVLGKGTGSREDIMRYLILPHTPVQAAVVGVGGVLVG
jgi:hypothetical protein